MGGEVDFGTSISPLSAGVDQGFNQKLKVGKSMFSGTRRDKKGKKLRFVLF